MRNHKEIDMRSKKIAAAAMGAALLGGGGLARLMTSSASAADSSTSTSASSDTSASNSTAKQRGEWMSTVLKKLVDAGTLTQAQSDAVTKALDAARPQGGPGGGPGHGHGGHGLNVAAKALGISAADLKTALQSGKTIAEVAKTNNVDIQTVIKAIVTAENAHIDEGLAAGHITQAQATERKSDATERATNLVNGVRPTPPTNSDASSNAALCKRV